MSVKGIRAAFLSHKTENNVSWKSIMDGEFDIVYATPELLLSPTGYFLREIAHNPKSAFHDRLVALAIDECHVPSAWGEEFRPEYGMIGILRECFRHVPCVGFSATLTPIGITKFSRLMRMANPQISCETVRGRNLKI